MTYHRAIYYSVPRLPGSAKERATSKTRARGKSPLSNPCPRVGEGEVQAA